MLYKCIKVKYSRKYLYQKQYTNFDKNIESYQTRINQLSKILDDISLKYKAEFEKKSIKMIKRRKYYD